MLSVCAVTLFLANKITPFLPCSLPFFGLFPCCRVQALIGFVGNQIDSANKTREKWMSGAAYTKQQLLTASPSIFRISYIAFWKIACQSYFMTMIPCNVFLPDFDGCIYHYLYLPKSLLLLHISCSSSRNYLPCHIFRQEYVLLVINCCIVLWMMPIIHLHRQLKMFIKCWFKWRCSIINKEFFVTFRQSIH